MVTGKLQGTYASIVNDEASEAYSGSNSFQYSSSNTHFDEANLYYHVDRFRHNFINNLTSGSGGLNFTQITAHAHANDQYYGDTNAWFSPSNGELYFGDASSNSAYNDFAKEDKVVYHEYSHAVIDDIQSGIHSENSEEGAISEGTPDYLAGSFTGRSIISDYVGAPRDMANPDISSYSQYESEEPVDPHRGGQFFSSILWDLYNSSLGKSTTDFLAFDALYRVTGNPDFLSFRDAMIAADYEAYNGNHNLIIRSAFANKGVGNIVAPPTGFSVTISGTHNTYLGAHNTWTADVSNGSSPYSYSWQKKDEGGTYWYIVGHQSSYTETINSTDDFDLKVIVTDASDSDTSDQISILVHDQPPFH